LNTSPHLRSARTGILVINLGTPEAPTRSAVRTYLKQFLSDPRVVEIPRLVWWLILHGIILPIRSGASAKKYASIWMQEGSPLLVYSKAQALGLQARFSTSNPSVIVDLAMRYGKPSIAEVLERFRQENVERLLLLPLYPQYSATTSASSFDEVFDVLKRWRNQPELRLVKHYHDSPAYIDALRQKIEEYWTQNGRPDFAKGAKLVMSFHGLPKRNLMQGDPYHCECYKTGRLLAEKLGLSKDQYKVTFQSRFGKAKWLEPYTEPTLIAMAQAGTQSVDVVCPGFTGDCLETLEEISMEGREAFLHAGGKTFNYIPCMNDEPLWIDALAAISAQHMQGWPTSTQAAQASAAELAKGRELAIGLGAKE
jgi:ferrochelatase